MSGVPQDLIGTTAVGKRLDVDPKTIVRWIRNGRLPAYRIGGRWKVSAAELDAWITGSRYLGDQPQAEPGALAGVEL